MVKIKLRLLAVPLIAITISACGGGKDNKKLEFQAYTCSVANDKCEEPPEIFKLKVRKFEETVLVNVFDSKGTALGNQFLDDCKIYDRLNWQCRSLSMVDGNLLVNTITELEWRRDGFYRKFVRRQ